MNGTITDGNGNYSLGTANANAKISFSFIGYQTQVLNIDGKTSINVTLVPDATELQEVQIVAQSTIADNGFLAVSKKEQVGAVQTIDLSEMVESANTSAAEALQGRVAGADIVMGSGDPGSGIQIQIRGSTSLFGNSKPLIVLDGVPYSTDGLDDFDFGSSSVEEYSSLIDIPVEDIRSISILKDAASAAVYGARAANGVVIISTKRGKRGKPRVEITSKLSLNTPPQQIPMLSGDQYSTMMLEALFNANNGLNIVPPVELSYDPTYEYYHEYAQNTNWIDEVTKTGTSQTYNIAVSGGGDKSRFRISTGYTDEKGTTIGTDLNRLNTNLNLDYDISRRIRFSADLKYSHTENQYNYTNIRSMAYIKSPNMSVYVRDSLGNPTDVFFSPRENFQGSGNEYFNPVAMGTEGYGRTYSERLLPKVQLRFNFTPSLYLVSYAALDINNKETRSFKPQIAVGTAWHNDATNVAAHNDGKRSEIQHQTKLIFSRELPFNILEGVLGSTGNENRIQKLSVVTSFNMEMVNSESFRGSSSNTASPYLQNYSVPSRLNNISMGHSQFRSVSVLSSGNYSILGRYLFSGTVRTESSSRFGDNVRWGVFPSYAVGWIISSEPFMSGMNWLDFLKVRYSYGINGWMPGSGTSFYSRYSQATDYMYMIAIRPENIELTNLRWEETTQRNLGIEMTVLDDLLNMEFDIYSKHTADHIISNYSLPESVGFGKLEYGNYASLSNRGWEFAMNWNLFRKNEKFRSAVYFNIARNQNIVDHMPENFSLEQGNPLKNGSYVRKIEIGKPVGSFYGYEFLGVFPNDDSNLLYDDEGNILYESDGLTPKRLRFENSSGYIFKGGDAIYADKNGDGVINELDVVYLGNAKADFSGGLGGNIYYKNFYLKAHMSYRIGHSIFNQTRMNTENMYNKNNQSVAVLRRWRKPGDEAEIPRALYQTGYNYLGSDRFIEDGTYMRISNVSIGYNLSRDLAKRLRANSAKAYITIYNPYIFTNYTGQDPEVGVNYKSPFDIGVDNARTPRPIRIILGLDIKL
jgi:TonB-linked SusC/RagA family outer membrane protein